MTRLAMIVAVTTLLVLAGVCWWGGLSPLSCTIHAAVGAAAMYVVVTVLGRIALSILVGAVIEGSANAREGTVSSDSRNPNR